MPCERRGPSGSNKCGDAWRTPSRDAMPLTRRRSDSRYLRLSAYLERLHQPTNQVNGTEVKRVREAFSEAMGREVSQLDLGVMLGLNLASVEVSK